MGANIYMNRVLLYVEIIFLEHGSGSVFTKCQAKAKFALELHFSSGTRGFSCRE